MPRWMMMPIFFLLTGSVFTQEEPISIYIRTQEKHIVLNGSDIPFDGVGVWEWSPHRDNLSSKTLVKVKAKVDGWTAEWLSEDYAFWFHRINDSRHLTIKNAAFEAAGLFTFRQTEPEGKILKQYEIFITEANYGKAYTNFWPIFGNNPLYLNCKTENRNQSTWYWKKYNHEKRRRVMSSDDKGQRDSTLTPEFRNRIRLQEFDGMSFPLQICPAEFEDAGNYTCTVETLEFVTVELITTKMTVIPSHPVVEGDDVTLTCSISHIREATRLIWMETGRKSFVKEKTFNPPEKGNISLSVFIQKVGQHNRKWSCLVFNREVPRIFITIQLEINEKSEAAYLKLILIPVVLVLLCLIAVMITYHRRVHKPVKDVQREPVQRKPCTAEIEYAAVSFQNRPVNENQRQPEDYQKISDSEPYQNEIHYAAIRFQKRSESTCSDGDGSSAIFGTITQKNI
ncbi:uncharacterized protein [Hemitrygon akajei]|uniref:uncharacterized protein isoform X1 n=1 Tax=Hemitrygon akajei TaxID=2704970 RepID=UPI003BFA039A